MNWFKNLKITRKILVFNILTAIFTVILGINGYSNLYKASNALFEVYNDNLLPIQWLNTVSSNMNGIKSDLFELFTVSDPGVQKELINDIKKRRSENNKMIASFQKTKLDNSELGNLNKFKAELKEYRAIQDKTVKLVMDNNKDEAIKYFIVNKQIIEQVQLSLKNLATYNAETASQNNKENNKDFTWSKMFILVNLILSMLITVPLGLFISRLISKPINAAVNNLEEVAKGNLTVKNIQVDSKDETGALAVSLNTTVNNLNNLVKEVSKSIDEISSGTEEMSAAADQTAFGAQQVSATISQLASGSQGQSENVHKTLTNMSSINRKVERIIESTEDTVSLSDLTETNANNGRNQAENAVKKINQLKVSSKEISETINELGKLGSDIEVIVDLIKNIASQTNLLALNAAIEAARAGEQGKGFAVVADEVKKLANQSEEATNHITKMIKEIQVKTNIAVITMNENAEEVDEGVIIIENVGQSLEEILEAAKDTSKNIQSISGEISRLSSNSNEVTTMMEDISSIAEQSAASAEDIASITQEQTASLQEVNASSQALAKIAENLQKQIAVFKV